MSEDVKRDAPAAERPDSGRRCFLQKSTTLTGAAALMALVPPGVRQAAWAAGSDAPEKKEVKIGFIPLTDCASVVMASVLEFDKKYGIKIIPTKEASWASVRDKLVNGDIDASHVLYGLIYGLHLGVSGPKKDMAILMTLNHNGQAITLSKKVADKGGVDGKSLAALMQKDKREYTYAQTFPTGTHAMWLYYWLAANGVHPFKDVKSIVVPPPQMVANMRVGNMDGFCVGEPWGHRAIADGIGVTGITTQDIWKDHPEKTLGCTADFVKQNPNTARAMTAAIIDAGRWIDASLSNRLKMAETVAATAFVNTSVDVINERILGRYTNGMGRTWDDPNHMKFYNDGYASYPWLSDGMWFLTQHRRWGLLKTDPDYLAVAKQINRVDIYREAATMAKASVPKELMRTSKLMDGVVWDGKDPEEVRGLLLRQSRIGGMKRMMMPASTAKLLSLESADAAPERHLQPAIVIAHPSAPALAAAADRAAAASEWTDRATQRQRRELAARLFAPVLGVFAFVAIWALVSQLGSIPGPAKTWQAAVQVFSDPFYRNGPNDQGIAWKIGGSLGRVGIGFGFAALVGIPLGFLIGRFGFLRNMAEPVIGLLRPVSPLAWLPIGLLVFKGANPAAIWTIFISSIWPMIINTAVGVQRVPSDYLNVARVLDLSEWKIFTKILYPAVLPYMLTGVRLSMGVAWLVIVAAEMLTGGVGLGFWVWDEWNNLKVENILIAIIVIGMIGLALEQLLLLAAKRWQYD